MKRTLLALSIAALAGVLASCHQGTAPAAATQSAAAAPDAKPGLTLTDGRLVLPAVKGNPAAAYFRLSNSSAKSAVVAAVDVAGAGNAMTLFLTQLFTLLAEARFEHAISWNDEGAPTGRGCTRDAGLGVAP